jgi:hypothetical protein
MPVRLQRGPDGLQRLRAGDQDVQRLHAADVQDRRLWLRGRGLRQRLQRHPLQRLHPRPGGILRRFVAEGVHARRQRHQDHELPPGLRLRRLLRREHRSRRRHVRRLRHRRPTLLPGRSARLHRQPHLSVERPLRRPLRQRPGPALLRGQHHDLPEQPRPRRRTPLLRRLIRRLLDRHLRLLPSHGTVHRPEQHHPPDLQQRRPVDLRRQRRMQEGPGQGPCSSGNDCTTRRCNTGARVCCAANGCCTDSDCGGGQRCTDGQCRCPDRTNDVSGSCVACGQRDSQPCCSSGSECASDRLVCGEKESATTAATRVSPVALDEGVSERQSAQSTPASAAGLCSQPVAIPLGRSTRRVPALVTRTDSIDACGSFGAHAPKLEGQSVQVPPRDAPEASD